MPPSGEKGIGPVIVELDQQAFRALVEGMSVVIGEMTTPHGPQRVAIRLTDDLWKELQQSWVESVRMESSRSEAPPSAKSNAAAEGGVSGEEIEDPVVCGLCGERFKSAVGGDKRNFQGIGCAVFPVLGVDGWYVHGHYGSIEYDCDIYKFAFDPPMVWKEASSICDGCVHTAVSQGMLVFHDQLSSTSN